MATSDDLDRLAVVEAVAHERRSNLRVDPDRPVADDLVDRLLTLAATAPNHRRTFPWRFRVLTGDARAALGEALAADLADWGDPEAKVEKARTKYLRAPTILVVASRPGTSPTMTAENRDAVAAAIQTLLLGATAAGLASYWSTGAAMDSPRMATLCRLDPEDRLVGVLYLGWPIEQPSPIDRPVPETVRLTDRSSEPTVED